MTKLSVAHIRKKFISYFLVGLIGIIIDEFVLYSLNIKLGVDKVISALISGECGNINNFTLNNIYTFKSSISKETLIQKILKYHAVVIFGLIISKVVFFPLLYDISIKFIPNKPSLLITNALATGVAMIINFSLNYIWTWKAHLEHNENNI